MKAIKITDANADGINAALDAVNGRATAHVATRLDIEVAAEALVDKLKASGLTAREMIGATATFRPAGPGKAYARKGRGVVTNEVALELRASGVFINSIAKIDVFADSRELMNVTISQTQRDIIIAKSVAAYTVA